MQTGAGNQSDDGRTTPAGEDSDSVPCLHVEEALFPFLLRYCC